MGKARMIARSFLRKPTYKQRRILKAIISEDRITERPQYSLNGMSEDEKARFIQAVVDDMEPIERADYDKAG